MKKILAINILVLLSISSLKAQKYDFSYGPILGLNMSFMDSKASIDYNYPFHELDRNISLSTESEVGLGYQAGIFIKIQPIESRLSLETNILITSYNNSYSLTYYGEEYFSTPWTTPVDNWMPETETEYLQNEFSILNIPVILGYNILKKENYNLTFLGGISPNIMIKDDHVKIDISFKENHLYKQFFLSYHAGIKADFGKILCMFKYERTFNIQEVSSRDYFPWQMKVEKLYINKFNFSVGYKLK